MRHTILLVDDDKANLRVFKKTLEDEGYAVHQASDARYAASLVQLNRGRYSLALMDYRMPTIMGDEATRILQRIDPNLQVVTLSGDSSEEAFAKNISAGSFAVINKAIGTNALLSAIASYCQRFDSKLKELAEQTRAPSENERIIREYGMVGASNELANTCLLISSFGPNSSSVLIRGENGTGKESVAKAIHARSLVSGGPFVAVNCAAIPEGLFESELFGHVKGAFTGAIQERLGHFRQADGGTIFLDEIGELPSQMQAKLLRVIQQRELTPVGSSKVIKVNIRIIAATNVDLEAAIKDGRFREDLYYRLNVLPITLNPLRGRLDDIEPLALHFQNQWSTANGKSKALRADALHAFKLYSWPGNIRELENTIHRSLSQARTDSVGLDDLPEHFKHLVHSSTEKPIDAVYQGIRAEAHQKERMFLESIIKTMGSISKAAKELRIPKTTLYDRMKVLGISTNQESEGGGSYETK